jgi:capsular polysaccharide transport system permease protein
MRRRHLGLALSFALLVLAPVALSVAYLYARAADQYHSRVAFSIRSEEVGAAAAGILGALTQIGTGSASDTDILYEYIRSQRIVEEIDAELDLRALYNAPEGDPVFALGEDASIEDLHAYWNRMVDVSLDGNAGIIEVRANAFAPEDARAIAAAILARSSALVNRLSEQARGDAIRFAREELAEAEESLRALRQRLADFRRENRIVDPSADVAGQMGLLNALQSELAQALVERDVLLSFADARDQRVIQSDRRIEAITARIEAERDALDRGGADGALADVVGAYEELLVDLEFANTAYTQALAGLAAARAEARRTSRYLAPHIQPTLAQTALYPRRARIAGLVALFLALGWGSLVLIYYNVRDNR